MAISPNAKRARNTSESEEKVLSKKKKHSEVATDAVSSPALSKGKKGRLSKVGTPKTEVQKAIKNKAVSIGSKKGGKETQLKSAKKLKNVSKVAKGKKSMEADEDESDEDDESEGNEQESEEGENEEVKEGDEEDSDEEAADNDGSDEAGAEEDADSDENESKEVGGKDDSDEDESDNEESDDDDEDKKDKKPQFGSRNNEFTLFVTNIPYSAEMDDLKKFFAVAGNVKEVRVPVNNKTGRPRGFAFVCMEDEEAMNAALKLDNEEMEGRPLKVQKSLDGGSGGGRFQRGGGGGRWRGDSRGFRGGRGFGRERRGGFSGDRGGRGFDRSRSFGGGERSSRGFGGERSSSRGFSGGGSGGSGGRGFKGDRDRKGGFDRSSRGSGRPWQDRDSSSKNSRQSGGDSD